MVQSVGKASKLTPEQKIRFEYAASRFVRSAVVEAQDAQRHDKLRLKDNPYSQTAQAFNALNVDEGEEEAKRLNAQAARRREFSFSEDSLFPAYEQDEPQDATAAMYGSGNSDSFSEPREGGTSRILAARIHRPTPQLMRSCNRDVDDIREIRERFSERQAVKGGMKK